MKNFDLNLAFLTSEKGRMKIKEIASLLKKSPQRVKYNLKQLGGEGVIRQAYCIFDYSYLGQILFRAYFKGVYVSEKDKENIINVLGENPYVVSITELSGEFDLAVEMESPNPSRFNKELKKLVGEIANLSNYKVVLNIVSHTYPRSYLVEESLSQFADRHIIVGGDRSKEEYTGNEMKVIGALLENPKARFSSLARKAGLDIKTVLSTFKWLQKRKIIKGFKSIIDTNKLGIYSYRLFLKLHNLSQEKEEQMMDYFREIKEIIQVNKTVGDWDMEVDVESLDKSRIRYLTIQLRERFKELIETFNLIEVYQYHKKTYLPAYLFRQEERNIQEIRG